MSSPTIAARFFVPVLANARLKAIAAGKELNRVLDNADLLQPDRRRLVDEALMHLADAVGGIDVLLEQLRGDGDQ